MNNHDPALQPEVKGRVQEKRSDQRQLVNKPKRQRQKKTPTGARAAAILSLLDVTAGRFPEEALEAYGFNLDERDRSLAAALVYGVLRWRSRLDWILKHFLRRPEKPLDPVVRIILEVGLFQLIHLDRIPASAAVNESVGLAGTYGPVWSPKLVNAVLRGVTRAKELPDPAQADLPEADKLALTEAHPLWLVTRLIESMGSEETRALLQANNTLPPLTLRTNTSRVNRDNLLALLEDNNIKVTKTRYSPVGLHVRGPTGPVVELPGFKEGFFAVQDEASQIIGLLVPGGAGVKALDACTGRGGKAMQLAETKETLVVGLDPVRGRLTQAAVETRRLGLKSVRLVQSDLLAGHPFPPQSFDVVLVDAPCSNLGVIRRRPDVKWSKSAQYPARLALFQSRLIESAATLVRPGGSLIYAVCTLTQEETVGVTQGFQASHPEFTIRPVQTILPEAAHPLARPDGLLQTWPHRHETDGFFGAVFERLMD